MVKAAVKRLLLFIVIKLNNMIPGIDFDRITRNLSLIVNYLTTRDFRNMEALHDDLRSNKSRLIIYPKDIETIYKCTPDEARSFLQDIRQSFNLFNLAAFLAPEETGPLI